MTVIASTINGVAVLRLQAPNGGVHLAASESPITLCGVEVEDMKPLESGVGMHLHCRSCIHLLREVSK